MDKKQTYKNKHLHQLNRLKNVALALALGSCMSGCKQKTPVKDNVIKDIAYYHETGETIARPDMFGHIANQKVVVFTVYKAADMKEVRFEQMRWGTPAEDLPNAYHNEKTHSELIYISPASEQGWVEVFVNQYGITVLKDQPCFAVGEDKKLVYIGDERSYDNSMRTYKQYLETKRKQTQTIAEKNEQHYRERQKRWDDKQLELAAAFETNDNVVKNTDSVASNNSETGGKKDTLGVRQMSLDTIQALTKDTLDRS